MSGGFKEQMVEHVRSQGYDFMTACELVHKMIQVLRTAPPGLHGYTLGRLHFTIRKGAPA